MEKLRNRTKVVILNNRHEDNLTFNSTLFDFKIGVIVDSCEEGSVVQYKVIDTDGEEHYGYLGQNIVTISYYKELLKEKALKAKDIIDKAHDINNSLKYISADSSFSLKARSRIFKAYHNNKK
jgi:hypothetical protein